MHLSEIARSLKENITLKKTIGRLSKNLNAFGDRDTLMRNYLSLVKHHVKDDYAVIIIDNSDIARPASRKPEALSEIRDGSTGEITQGYLSIEAAVLSEKGKMPLPVYEIHILCIGLCNRTGSVHGTEGDKCLLSQKSQITTDNPV